MKLNSVYFSSLIFNNLQFQSFPFTQLTTAFFSAYRSCSVWDSNCTFVHNADELPWSGGGGPLTFGVRLLLPVSEFIELVRPVNQRSAAVEHPDRTEHRIGCHETEAIVNPHLQLDRNIREATEINKLSQLYRAHGNRLGKVKRSSLYPSNPPF